MTGIELFDKARLIKNGKNAQKAALFMLDYGIPYRLALIALVGRSKSLDYVEPFPLKKVEPVAVTFMKVHNGPRN